MKVIHILGYDELKFNLPLVEMLTNKKLGWHDEFFFATNCEGVFEKIKQYQNTIFFKNGISFFINSIYKSYDLIIIQGWNQSVPRAALLKKKAAKKIVWRFWGSDYFPYEECESLKRRALGRIFFKRLSHLISCFYAIGYGGKTDLMFIQNRFGIKRELKGYPLFFSFQNGKGALYKRLYKSACENQNETFKIMVGHSANKREMHLITLERLRKFSKNNIEIILVVSYGNMKYKDVVINKAKEIFGDKATIIDNMLPIDSYRAMLSGVDAFAIESMGSNALGNINDLAYLGKKIFVKKNSFLDNYLTENSVEHFFVDDMDNMTFEELKNCSYDMDKNHNAFLFKEDDYFAVNTHKNLYDDYRGYLCHEQ